MQKIVKINFRSVFCHVVVILFVNVYVSFTTIKLVPQIAYFDYYRSTFQLYCNRGDRQLER
jgi:hypothetical protein